MDKELEKNYQNVVFIILDGLGKSILDDHLQNGFFENHLADVVTSTCPSTTTAAMTTYYSGKPPIETGWIAMSQYFKEYGRAVEMLRRIDSYTQEPLHNVRMDVYDKMDYEKIYDKIEKASPDVKAYEVNPGFCEARSKRNIKADNIEYLCDAIEAICSNQDRNFILGYQENPDALLHKFGTKAEEVKRYVKTAEEAIQNMCKKLEGTNTLVIVTADHGHQDIETVYPILELEEIQDCMIMPASLESRSVTFWVKEEKKKKFEQYFQDHLKDEFILYTKEEFLAKGLLGFGKQHEKVDDFLGNYIAVAIGSSIIKLETYVGKEKKDKKATHCGFTKNEMEVPVIIVECK